MPTYQYICENCKSQFERFESITAKPARKCPHCKKNKLRRLIGTGSGIIFKGNGFYQTDYRSESYKKAVKTEKEPTAAKTKTSETKSEPKKPPKKDKS